MAYQRFAETGVTREDENADAIRQAGEKLVERLFMAGGGIITDIVRRGRKRSLPESEACDVHVRETPPLHRRQRGVSSSLSADERRGVEYSPQRHKERE